MHGSAERCHRCPHSGVPPGEIWARSQSVGQGRLLPGLPPFLGPFQLQSVRTQLSTLGCSFPFSPYLVRPPFGTLARGGYFGRLR